MTILPSIVPLMDQHGFHHNRHNEDTRQGPPRQFHSRYPIPRFLPPSHVTGGGGVCSGGGASTSSGGGGGGGIFPLPSVVHPAIVRSRCRSRQRRLRHDRHRRSCLVLRAIVGCSIVVLSV